MKYIKGFTALILNLPKLLVFAINETLDVMWKIVKGENGETEGVFEYAYDLNVKDIIPIAIDWVVIVAISLVRNIPTALVVFYWYSLFKSIIVYVVNKYK